MDDRTTITAETSPDFEVEAITTAQGVRDFYAFADPILGVDWGPDGMPEEYTPEYVVGHPQETQIYVIRDSDGTIIAGGKIREIKKNDRSRLGLDTGTYANKKGALLEYRCVDKNRRRSGLQKKLNKDRFKWAADNNFDYICGELEIERPIAIFTLMKYKFRMIGIKEPEAGLRYPYFVAVRDIAAQDGNTHGAVDEGTVEKKEISITPGSETRSIETLKNLFAEGWVGFSIKFGDEDSPWTLLLEKPAST